MARELHDAIAHGVSVMVLQAGAAEQVLVAQPEQARQAMRAVQQAGRTALEELRPLLGVLATNDHENRRVAPPSLTELDALVANIRGAGLPVELYVHGLPATLPIGVDACAYRVIQEGLTNALKHGASLAVAVNIHFNSEVLTLEIINIIHAVTTAGEGGHGLIGMRERVELYGGELQAGPGSDGRYVLRVRLPLRADGR